MAKSTTKKNIKYSFSDAINKTIGVEEEQNKKSGRPSKGKVRKMTLAIPENLFNDVEIAASLFFKGNKTAYINSLIKKDLEENLSKYKEFKKMLE